MNEEEVENIKKKETKTSNLPAWFLASALLLLQNALLACEVNKNLVVAANELLVISPQLVEVKKKK